MTLLEHAERRRVNALEVIGYDNLDVNEQFFTPLKVAQIMADILVADSSNLEEVRLLDPGAGTGILTVAVIDRLKQCSPNADIKVVVVEKDPLLLGALEETLSDTALAYEGVSYEIVNDNFLYWATESDTLFGDPGSVREFDLVIQNPPYSKLSAQGVENQHLKKCGITTPNIYAAFMALGNKLLAKGGVMVSITPRSWMNGTYFSKFRNDLFRESYLSAIHTFESRRDVFKDTGVLQESVVTALTKSGVVPSEVAISSSKSQAHDIATRRVPYSSVLVNGVVFVPATDDDVSAVEWISRASCQLEDLKIKVSTGRVVDFRTRKRLVDIEGQNTVPMVYPANFQQGKLTHPTPNPKKPQYYKSDDINLDKNLVPPGIYVLVKRFSAKEERRRITAAIWDSTSSAAFDNKTNFFHIGGEGIPPKIAEGLCKWLNSKRVDSFFRVFSGHTQVNATDLRMMPYPTLEQLEKIAETDADADDSVEMVMD